MSPEALDPRVRRTHAAVAASAAQVLLEEGWSAVRHARVAKASGYAKATLYAHWPTPVDLLRAAFLHIGGMPHGPVTGDLRADLIAELEVFRRVLLDEQLAVAMIALADRAAVDADVAALRDSFLSHGQSVTLDHVRRALGGELRSDLAVQPAVDMLSGALAYRVAVMGEAVDTAYVERIVDVFLNGARPR